MSYIKNMFNKLKKIKNIEIVVAIILCLIILCVYLSSVTVSTTVDSTVIDLEQYVAELESKLEALICAIEGVSGCVVAISYDGSIVSEYAYDTDITESGDDIYTSSQIVLVDGQPLLIRQIVPSIVGVVVVLEGTNSAIIDMYVLQAVTTLLDIDNSKVEII